MNVYFQNFYKYKDLFIELIIKDIKLKYRNSFLGVIWSMLNPLLVMVVLSVVFMAVFRNDIPNFPVYVLIGRVLYAYFSEATSFAMDAIYANGQLIKKVYVPKYLFPLSRICSSFITSLVALIPLVMMMAFLGMPFTWVNLLFVIPLFYLLVISIGVGLFLSSISVFFKDMQHFYSIVLLILMYTTPIFYPVSIIPDQFMPFIMLNPLYWVVEMFRDVVMYGIFPEFHAHLILIFYMIFYGVLGLWMFYKTQDRFIYHL